MALTFDDMPKYQEMVDALILLETQTSYVEADLTQFKFDRDTEWGTVDDGLTGRKELTEWSCRQLCKMAGIPFTFFRKSSPDLAKEAFEEWVPIMKRPQVKLALRSYGKSKEVVRGILPQDYPEVRNSEVISAIASTGVDFVVESAKWMDTVDPPFIRTRFVIESMKDALGPGDDLHMGVDVLCSELAAAPLIINLLLFRLVCRNGAIAVYDSKPYFHFDYRAGAIFDMVDVLTLGVNRLAEDSLMMFNAAKKTVGVTLTTEQAKLIIAEMVKTNSINKGVAVKTISEIDKSGASTGWDVANALTASARGFRDVLRLRYESAAGSLLGLNFTRKQGKEDTFAISAPDRALPPAFKVV